MSQAQYQRVAIGAHFLDAAAFAAGLLPNADRVTVMVRGQVEVDSLPVL
jgi:hypothetical protein